VGSDVSVTIRADSFRHAAAALEDSDAIPKAIGVFVDQVAPEALRAVKARARRHRRTGELEAGITLEQTGSGASSRATVSIGGGHGPVLVTGSVPHPIRARHGRPMPFAAAAGRFAWSVRHPGTQPDPILDLALEDLGGAADAALSVAGARLVDELADDLQRRI